MTITTTDAAPLVAVAAGAAAIERADKPSGPEPPAAGAGEGAAAQAAARAAIAHAIQLPEFRHTELSFQIEEGGRVVVHVIDSTTGDVLRTIPPEELVRAARQLQARGILLDREG